MKSTPNPTLKGKGSVVLSIEEFEYLMKCERELHNVKTLIGELLGGEQV